MVSGKTPLPRWCLMAVSWGRSREGQLRALSLRGGRGRQFSCTAFIRSLIPHVGAPPSWLKELVKTVY